MHCRAHTINNTESAEMLKIVEADFSVKSLLERVQRSGRARTGPLRVVEVTVRMVVVIADSTQGIQHCGPGASQTRSGHGPNL
jgi:hypothetical protein